MSADTTSASESGKKQSKLWSFMAAHFAVATGLIVIGAIIEPFGTAVHSVETVVEKAAIGTMDFMFA